MTSVHSEKRTAQADATDGVIGAALTTGLILIFGEIFPQSVCSRYGLRIGALTTPLVWFFVVCFFVVCYPLSLILDYVLGREVAAVYSKNELKELVRIWAVPKAESRRRRGYNLDS